MNSLSLIVLGVVLFVGAIGFLYFVIAESVSSNDVEEDREIENVEMKVLPHEDDYSDRENDLSDHSKVA